MLKFVIGVDKRSGRLGADIERFLAQTYDISEFNVVGLECSLPRNSIRNLAAQVDTILKAIYYFPARFYLGLACGRVIFPTKHCSVPMPITAMTLVDTDGRIHFDCIEPLGYYIPLEQRNYTLLPREADLLEVLGGIIAEAAGIEPEPLPHSLDCRPLA